MSKLRLNKAGWLAAILSMGLLASCAATRLTSVWKNDAYEGGKFRKVLVIGIAQKETVRRLFEDEFVRQLRARGADGIPGYLVFPSDKMVDRDALATKVSALKVDGVLISRMVDKKVIETYVPGEVTYLPPPSYYHGWYGYYSGSYLYVVPPRKIEHELYVAETNLYEAKHEDLVWSALSETFPEGSAESVIKEFITVIVDDLAAKNLL